MGVEERFEEDNESAENTPSASIDNDVEETPRSTKEPLKLKPNRKRQAEEEFKLIQGLAHSIAERKAKTQQTKKPATNHVESFGLYVTHTLSELDTRTQHLAEHKINEILFKAQSGLLAEEYSYETMNMPMRPQQQFLQPYGMQYSMTGMNQPISTNSQFHVEEQYSVTQNNSMHPNSNTPKGNWGLQNAQGAATQADRHKNIQQL